MTLEIKKKLAQAVLNGDISTAKDLAVEAVKKRGDIRACITGVREGLQRAGKLHASGEYLLSDLFNSTEAMRAALSILESAL
ncbi:MAG: hypothetical protein GY755_19680 [Chloroflexi bacterium]|nr:hypothetical protein [Chloroflexota bacterium]